MKRKILFISFLIVTALANAQSPAFEWAKDMGGPTGTVTGTSIAVSAIQDVYTTGYFRGTADFDPGTATFYLSTAGSEDIFVSGLNSAGSIIWAKQMGGTSSDYGNSIAVDGSGNVYTTGYFNGTSDFDPGAGTYNLTSFGSSDIFISKLDASGNFVWVRQFGGISADYGNSIAVDGSGNVYTTGTFRGTADFDPGGGTFNLISAGSEDIFISKLDASGNLVWAKQLGGASSDYGNSLAVNATGNIYTTGYFNGTADFDPNAGVSNLVSAGSSDIFISKLDASGNFVWAKQLGGTSADYGKSLALDGMGNIYTTGYFNGTGDFDPGAGTFNLISAGISDAFVSKLDVSGNFLWAKQFGGTSYDYAYSVKVDGSAVLYITGTFSGTVDFDPGAGIYNLSALGSSEIFISRFQPNGNFDWAKSIGGDGEDIGNSIAVDASHNVITTGSYYFLVDFDPGAGIFNLPYSSGNFWQFISKLDVSGNFVWAKHAGNSSTAMGKSVATDASGNVYTTGYFYGVVDFDPGAGIFNLANIPSGDRQDIFISKSDASGNFVWALRLGGVASDEANSIAADASGNIYVTGYFKDTVDFDPGPGIFNLNCVNERDVFILKLDVSGNFIWVKQIGGSSSYVYGTSIAVDGSGNVYTSGHFHSGITDFDPGPGTFYMTPSSDITFISKLDASGNFVWAKGLGGSFTVLGNSIALDASSNVYTTGYFQGTTDFDPGAGTFNLTPANGSYPAIFVSKLDASGNFVWAKKIGGDEGCYGNSLKIDVSGNVLITGYFNGTADFDPDAGTFNLTTAGGIDIFISKLDASGNFVWAKQMGGTINDSGNSIAIDEFGNVYTTGLFNGTADFDPGAGTFNLTSFGSNDIFISKLDASGNFVWTKQLGGTYSEYAKSIAVDIAGNVYTTGNFLGTGDYDPGAGTFNLYLTDALGKPDLFVHKMSQCILPSAVVTPGGAVAFCSGGNIILNANTGTGLAYQWKLNTADITGATNSSYTATAAGNYTVVVSNSCGTATSSATTVTVNSLPSATITPGVPTTFCSGGSVVLNAPVAANRTYQWKKGANLISGATLSSYTATTGGNYRVIVTNTVTGCSKTTNSATIVTVNSLPAATITPQGPTTFCAGGSVVLAANTGAGLTYKWKKAGGYISGATLSNYTATTGGNYRVEVTNSNGCSKTSGLVAVSVPCKEGENLFSENSFNVKVYPNPSSGDFVFEISNAVNEKIYVNIYDMIGKLVLSETIHNSTFNIHNSQLVPGVYSAAISNAENPGRSGQVKRVLKLVKTE